jgi:acyl CoA:acetate/3-ketoacid CoA transferase
MPCRKIISRQKVVNAGIGIFAIAISLLYQGACPMHFTVEAALWMGFQLEGVNHSLDVLHKGMPFLYTQFDKSTIN